MKNSSQNTEGWYNVDFGDVMSIISDGGTPSRSVDKYFGGNIPWVVIDDIKDEIFETKEYLTELGLAACSSNFWDIDTVILSTGATIGCVGMLKVKSATKQGICGITFKEKVDNKYMMYLLKTMKNELLSNSQGSTIREIRPTLIKKFKIFIPKDKVEQQKIASILSKTDAAIAETEALIAKYTRLKTGLMQDLLTKGIDENGVIRSEETHEFKDSALGRIPIEWGVQTLGDLKEFITSGSRGWAEYYSIEGNLFIRITNLKRNQITIDKSDLKYVNLPESAEGKRSKLAEGDLLISITADLGIIGVVPNNFGEAYVNQHIALVRLDKELVESKFIGYFLISDKGQSLFNYYNDGGAKAGISLKTINEINVLVPSKEEQITIVNRIEKVNDLLSTNLVQLSKLESVKTGLLQDLLSGRVRVFE